MNQKTSLLTLESVGSSVELSPLQKVLANREFILAIKTAVQDGHRTSRDTYSDSALPGNVQALNRFALTLRQLERELKPLGFTIKNFSGQVHFLAPESFLPGTELRFVYFSGAMLSPEDEGYVDDDSFHVYRKGPSTRIAIERQDKPCDQPSLFDDHTAPPKIDRAMFVIVNYRSASLNFLPEAWLTYPAALNADGTVISCQDIARLDLSDNENGLTAPAALPKPIDVRPELDELVLGE